MLALVYIKKKKLYYKLKKSFSYGSTPIYRRCNIE